MHTLKLPILSVIYKQINLLFIAYIIFSHVVFLGIYPDTI